MKQPDKNISRYPVPEFDSLPEDLKETFLAVQEQFGFVPNVFFALAHRPAELRAFLAYNEALMNKESGLTPAEKEMLIIAHSNYNGCTYCVMSHGAALRGITENPYIAEPIAVNYHEADITPREKAIIDFAMKLTIEPATVNENDFEVLKGFGLNDEDIWDVAGITSFFNLSNRMMNFAAVRPDDQFFSMGR
ncbi:peroxidase-related enzyme [Lutibacter oricola]|nr:peroxidase-related enzyme [Lutibacter oricola]